MTRPYPRPSAYERPLPGRIVPDVIPYLPGQGAGLSGCHQGAGCSPFTDHPERVTSLSQVAESARLLLGHGYGHRVLAEVGDRVAEVIQQQGGHVLADAQADQDALYGDIGNPSGEGVGRYLPALVAQPVGQGEQGVAGVLALADPPGDRRDARVRVAVTQQLERPGLDDLGRQGLPALIGRLVDAPVALMPEPQEV